MLSAALFASEENLTSLTDSIHVSPSPLCFITVITFFSLVISTKELEEATVPSLLCSPAKSSTLH